jgi:hypothetical protein
VPALRAGVFVRSPLDEGLRVTLRWIGARLLNGERKARAHLVSTVTIWSLRLNRLSVGPERIAMTSSGYPFGGGPDWSAVDGCRIGGEALVGVGVVDLLVIPCGGCVILETEVPGKTDR